MAGAGKQQCEWLGRLLHKMLNPEEGKDGKAASAAALRESVAAERVCVQLVSQLTEQLVCLEESGESATDTEAMGQALHALALFCTAKPPLVLPHLDVIAHFLKHEQARRARPRHAARAHAAHARIPPPVPNLPPPCRANARRTRCWR